MIKGLKRANGLRNVLVNVYSCIIDKLALESMMELFSIIDGFIVVVERWLEER